MEGCLLADDLHRVSSQSAKLSLKGNGNSRRRPTPLRQSNSSSNLALCRLAKLFEEEVGFSKVSAITDKELGPHDREGSTVSKLKLLSPLLEGSG
jgi:hypothetical protein